MTDDALDIRPVTDDDAGELLTLRRAAFVTEAQLIGDVSIPPLTQTLDELRADLARPDVVTLGAWAGPRLVASIRVLSEGSKATLGRFAVAPDLQGRGIGSRLVAVVEERYADEVTRYELFTGPKSERNAALYRRLGYVDMPSPPGQEPLVYLEKRLPPA